MLRIEICGTTWVAHPDRSMGCFSSRSSSVLDGSGRAGLPQWAKALEEGIRAISELGGAKPGNRTMLDARDSFVRSLKSAEASFSRLSKRIGAPRRRAISEAVFAN
jgi:DAK2 domain